MSGKAYRLKDGERAKHGVRRAAAGRAAKAVERLRDNAPEDLAGAVHGARKDLKKLRSLLRLVRTGLGEAGYKRENDRFRTAAVALGGAREAEARLECLAKLRDRYGEEFPTPWSHEFSAMLKAKRDRIASGPLPRGVFDAIEQIEQGGRASHSWKLRDDGFELFERGLRRTYKRGRKGLAATTRDPSGDELHEWRKRVKDLWYQLRFLQRTWPEIVMPISEQAHELSSILGDHHDLEIIGEEIERHPGLFRGNAQAKMLALVDRRQQELVDEAVPIGERLYCEKPQLFTARIARYWGVR